MLEEELLPISGQHEMESDDASRNHFTCEKAREGKKCSFHVHIIYVYVCRSNE